MIDVDELSIALMIANMQQEENWNVYIEELTNHFNDKNFDEAVDYLISFIDSQHDMLNHKKEQLRMLQSKNSGVIQ